MPKKTFSALCILLALGTSVTVCTAHAQEGAFLREFNFSELDQVKSVAVDATGVYVVGDGGAGIFLRKWSPGSSRLHNSLPAPERFCRKPPEPPHMAANSTSLPNTLGGVSVTFNGIAAPLLFVSPEQINAQVPWAVLRPGATTGSVSMVVRLHGRIVWQARAVQIAPVSPGIFSVESGVGQGIAVNADRSLSAAAGLIPGVPSAPARVGKTIMVLATGLGVVDPPGRDGQASLDAQGRTLAIPVVLIGGMQAEVRFSGLSPQFAGVYQLNVVVPPVTPGDQVPIQIRLGDISSTERTTIAVGN